MIRESTMTDKDHQADTPPNNPAGSVRVGREALSNVFRSDGGSELSSHHNTRLLQTDNDTVTGPQLRHEIVDGEGPADTRLINDALPGPSLHHEMTDAEGAADLRQMQDAEGPIVPRKTLEDHYYPQGKQELPATPQRSDEQTATADATGVHAPPSIHLDTYSIHMEDRLARVKASQKETLEKMKQRQADDKTPSEPWSETGSDATPVLSPEAGNVPTERHFLVLSAIHPAIRTSIALHQRDIVDEVMQAIASYPVVVVGMGGNPFVSRTRKLLDRAGIAHHYLGYGNYLTGWRRRNALKMWTGWPTFPMIFIRGMLIGGYQDLHALMTSDEIRTLLQE